jgi:hypothetical protein
MKSRMRYAVLLPAIFAVLVIPVVLFVISGAGTHMSALLLYIPAAPWWLLYGGETSASEMAVLLIGCALNGFLLYLLGAALDRRRRLRSGRS